MVWSISKIGIRVSFSRSVSQEALANPLSSGRVESDLQDADDVLRAAFAECATKPDACPLYEKTAEAVEQRYRDIMTALKANPLPVHDGVHAGFVEWRSVHRLMFFGLYKPYNQFAGIFEGLADAEKGNGLKLFRLIRALEPEFTCRCGEEGPPSLPGVLGIRKETTRAVICTDSGAFKGGIDGAREILERMTKISEFANIWQQGIIACA